VALVTPRASSEELLLIAERFERMVAMKRLVDEASGEEDGPGMVMLSAREVELIAECLRTIGANRWREGQ